MERVLITRPQRDGEALATLLNEQGVEALIQPLFTIKPGSELPQLAEKLKHSDIVIAVSKHAVLQASKYLSLWPKELTYLAVGKGTKSSWQKSNPNPIVTPRKQDSEGLLELPQLHSVHFSTILILRGQSGRELLAQTLRLRDANVSYCECYRREAISFHDPLLIERWQQMGVTSWVATSSEQLEQIENLCSSQQKEWLHQLKLIIVSSRLKERALHLGFQTIFQSADASNPELLNAIKAATTG